MDYERQSSWEQAWGTCYGDPFKNRVLESLFEKMNAEGKIGSVVVDVGSGIDPASWFIPDGPKVIAIDIAGEPKVSDAELHVKCDVEEVWKGETPDAQKALSQIASFLSIELPGNKQIQPFSTMIFSELLNYVPYQEVLDSSAEYLEPGGRFVIVNQPTRGFKHLFSPRGVKSNTELLQHLDTINFEVEHKEFQLGVVGEENQDHTLMVLVARKMLAEG